MEPVTHVLTGACLARAGLNRRAAYATLAMAIAAELPDIDVLWGFRGPVAAFQHHRGITHTFIGVPFEAALVVGFCYAVHLWRARRHRTRPATAPIPADPTTSHRERPLTAAPVRWGRLYGFAVLALLSHLLLDYTNNYGLRPFFPFNPHWYAASIVFIFDPLLFAFLVVGLVAPWIFRIVSAEVGARRQPFAAPGWADAALLLVVGLWGVRWVEHDRAVQLAMSQSLEAPPTPAEEAQTPAANSAPTPAWTPALPTFLSARRALANPDPLSIFRWYTVTDFGPIYQLERADTSLQTLVATEGTYAKPAPSAAIRAAEGSQLGRAYLDWSPMPILTLDSSPGAVEQAMADADVPAPRGGSIVIFRDPRFMGVFPWRTGGRTPPLTGVVVVDAQQHVVRQSMDGHNQPAN